MFYTDGFKRYKLWHIFFINRGKRFLKNTKTMRTWVTRRDNEIKELHLNLLENTLSTSPHFVIEPYINTSYYPSTSHRLRWAAASLNNYPD